MRGGFDHLTDLHTPPDPPGIPPVIQYYYISLRAAMTHTTLQSENIAQEEETKFKFNSKENVCVVPSCRIRPVKTLCAELGQVTKCITVLLSCHSLNTNTSYGMGKGLPAQSNTMHGDSRRESTCTLHKLAQQSSPHLSSFRDESSLTGPVRSHTPILILVPCSL